MKKVCSASNLVEAQIMLDLLGCASIDARLLNANAQSGVGELPFTHAYPEVWVMNDNDLTQGKEIITNYERAPVETGVVFCRSCNEENPRNFELCWHCGATLE